MRFLIIFVTLISLLPALYAQQKVFVTGEVTDNENNPIPQALVAIEGTTTGVYTDDNGSYSLEISQGKRVISISAIGFKLLKTTVEIRSNRQQDFILEKLVINLSSVEIYGKTKSQQLRESSFSVNSLDVKGMASELNNLNALVGRSSGIKIREDGGVGADFDLSINGLSGNSVRYFIDGVPLTSIGNGVSLANLPVNIVDRVEIYKGVVPADLGADALGGAINILTKKEVKNYLDVSYGIGSFGTYKADFSAQYTEPKSGLFIRPSIGVNYSKNNYKMKGVEVWNTTTEEFEMVTVERFHDDYCSFFGQTSIGVANKKWADLFSVTASYSSTDKDLQTGSVQNKVYGMATRESDAYNIGGQYRKRNFLTKGLTTELFLSQTWDYSIVVDTAYRKYRWDGSYTETSRNEITGRGKSIRHTIRPLTIGRANFDYLLNEYHSFNVNYLFDHVSNKRTDDFDSEFEPTKDFLSKHIVGVSYKQSFLQDRLANTFFVKEYITHLKVGQQDLSWITGSNKIESSSTNNNWGYGITSRYFFSDLLAVKASFERSVRLPLTREYLGNGSTIYPNFLLTPENSRNFNLGLFGTFRLAPQHNLHYDVNLFNRKVKDYIRYVISDSEGTGQYENVSNVTVSGIEGELHYDYNDMFQTIVNISYLDEKSKTKYQLNGKPNATYNNRVPNNPWLFSNIELNFKKKNIFGQKNNQLKAAYYFQYVHWFYLTWKDYGSFNSDYVIPTQYLNNVSLTYSLNKESYNVSLECTNIFDNKVYDNYMMQKPGRAIFCKLRVFIN